MLNVSLPVLFPTPSLRGDTYGIAWQVYGEQRQLICLQCVVVRNRLGVPLPYSEDPK
jgi:hypothetical protein